MLTESFQAIDQSGNRVSIENLAFSPAPGFRSPHIQTVLPTFFSEIGEEPPAIPIIIELGDGDALYCKLSTPLDWSPHRKTIVLLHGLAGSDASSYMIRMSRKFYQAGYRCLRVNLRGSGKGVNFANRPYHGGTSHDILEIVKTLKLQAPTSPIILIGYSLGGNIALKLLAELKERASELIAMAITICSPIDLAQTMDLLLQPVNRMYHRYYVKALRVMGARWIGQNVIRSIPDFDNMVTAPQWGFRDAAEYYQQNSSRFLLPNIKQSCHLIFAKDDPFVDYRSALQPFLSPKMKIWLSPYGGHMGFWGWVNNEHRYHWLDALLVKMVREHSVHV